MTTAPAAELSEMKVLSVLDAYAWCVEYTHAGAPVRQLMFCNGVGDYRMLDPQAISKPLFTKEYVEALLADGGEWRGKLATQCGETLAAIDQLSALRTEVDALRREIAERQAELRDYCLEVYGLQDQLATATQRAEVAEARLASQSESNKHART